ncbi:MAG: oxidoreductase [Candidatus Fervidibacter sp.]|uniref:oxidoreductase n=1 Tax=Candidatus Fervidibacter sp. TaxID=3100871 RepID=UPI00404ACFD2
MQPEHAILFEPLQVRKWNLRNRIVCPPMVTNRDILSEDGIKWYQRIAHGGVGLLIVEATRTTKFEDGTLDAKNLSRLAEAIKQEGAVAAIQLFMAPVDRKNSPDELTKSDIRLSVERFKKAALICKEAGFDGVEPHGAHGFLLNQFFSRRTNHRTDEYGGSLENRMRLGLQIVQEIREAVGDDMLILYRHTPKEYEGYTLEESVEFAKRLEETGVEILDISPASKNAPADLAAPFKQSVNIPVIAVGKMSRHARAVEALREGRADLIAIGRGLIADPFWAIKTKTGQIDKIIECRYCNEGCYGNLRPGTPIECVQHAELGELLLWR